MFMNWNHQKISSKNITQTYCPKISSRRRWTTLHGWSEKIIHTYTKFESSLSRNIRVSWKLRAMSWCTFWCSRQATLKKCSELFFTDECNSSSHFLQHENHQNCLNAFELQSHLSKVQEYTQGNIHSQFYSKMMITS